MILHKRDVRKTYAHGVTLFVPFPRVRVFRIWIRINPYDFILPGSESSAFGRIRKWIRILVKLWNYILFNFGPKKLKKIPLEKAFHEIFSCFVGYSTKISSRKQIKINWSFFFFRWLLRQVKIMKKQDLI